MDKSCFFKNKIKTKREVELFLLVIWLKAFTKPNKKEMGSIFDDFSEMKIFGTRWCSSFFCWVLILTLYASHPGCQWQMNWYSLVGIYLGN